jgi:hypothetical protein
MKLRKMFADDEPLFPARPFWFASTELLTNVLRAEINAVTQLLAKYPDLPDLLDVPEATIPQHTACFELLAHRKLIEMIFEIFDGPYEESPSLGYEESNALRRTQNLVASDAPAWVLEINEVVELLPSRLSAALPEALRTEGFDPNNSAQVETIKSAAKTLSSVEQIRAWAGGVLDHQLRRLERRWPAAIVQVRAPHMRKGQRKRDKQRMVRDNLIAEIDDVAETIVEFLRLMDDRKVKPQPTWTDWPGSWVQAYKNPRLRELIHKDKSRALSRARPGRSR